MRQTGSELERLHAMKRWPKKSRPRFHREFIAWANNAENPLQEHLSYAYRKGGYLEARLNGLRAEIVLSVWASIQSISVWVMHEGRAWDWVHDFDAPAARTPEGYICRMCRDWPAEDIVGMPQPVYPSREALWQAHVFTDFASWAVRELSLRRTIEYYDWGEGSTWTYWSRPGDTSG